MMNVDTVVIGGGPAGATAAVLLARSGATVALVDPGGTAPRLEGLSPRGRAIVDRLGLPAGGISPPVPRTAQWGERTGRANVEHLVRRAPFDAALRRQAAAEGVTVRPVPAHGIAPGRVTLADGTFIQARTVFDARGRRAARAPGGARGPASVAIAGWSGMATAAGARVRACAAGWIWRAASAPGTCWTQIVTDAAALAEGGRAGLAHAWRRIAGDDGPPLPATPVVRAAELRQSAPLFDPDRIALGDAAVAMDPLSGHGLFWALSSALMAPPLASALAEGKADLARRFWQDRVSETFWRQARVGRDFHRLVPFDTPFWTARRAFPDEAPAHRAVKAPGLERRVVVRDGRLAEAEVLVTPRDPGGVAFVHGHAIAPIVRMIGGRGLPDERTFAREVLPHAPPREAEAVRRWLAHRGIGGGPPEPIKDREHVT